MIDVGDDGNISEVLYHDEFRLAKRAQATRFTDYKQCMEATQPDMVILCPPTAEHAKWVEQIAPYNVHIFIEKPFAHRALRNEVRRFLV